MTIEIISLDLTVRNKTTVPVGLNTEQKRQSLTRCLLFNKVGTLFLADRSPVIVKGYAGFTESKFYIGRRSVSEVYRTVLFTTILSCLEHEMLVQLPVEVETTEDFLGSQKAD
jgi:hypothetical protein